jgi:hypothetical protein
MKMTLLDMVQNILTAMNSDAVNSISDTIESEQVAMTVKDVYMKMCATREIPVHLANVEMLASGSLQRPTVLKIPDNVEDILELSYNDKPLKFLYPDEFSYMMRNRVESTIVEKITDGVGYVFKIYVDRDPEYYTTYDDKELFFDAYDKTKSDTLLASNSLAYVELFPSFEMVDDYIPDLPSHMFPYLLEAAKSLSFVNVKQMPNAAVEKGAMELRAYNSRHKRIQKNGIRTNYYGRK